MPSKPKEKVLISYRIGDMTCGHCVSTITKAITALDDGATVDADIAKHLLSVKSVKLGAAEVQKAIEVAGYSPVPLAPEATPKITIASSRGGCCGCCG